MIGNYWGLCSLVDTHVGTILDTLQDCGRHDNTIVVFTSDHGDMMGSHRLLAKCVMFEEAVRVPLLIRLPGQKAGKRVTGPISQIDLVPTLLELMAQPVPDPLQGKSLVPLLTGEGDAAHEESVFIEWNGPNNGLGDTTGQVQFPEWMLELASQERIVAAFRDPVRTIVTPEGWKFNCSPLGEHELYHLGEDPLETRNLAGESGYRSLMRELTDQIRAWQAETGDIVAL
jgi:arylsulfatase A-like enzyme